MLFSGVLIQSLVFSGLAPCPPTPRTKISAEQHGHGDIVRSLRSGRYPKKMRGAFSMEVGAHDLPEVEAKACLHGPSMLHI
jgi:hypothetical protein